MVVALLVAVAACAVVALVLVVIHASWSFAKSALGLPRGLPRGLRGEPAEARARHLSLLRYMRYSRSDGFHNLNSNSRPVRLRLKGLQTTIRL